MLVTPARIDIQQSRVGPDDIADTIKNSPIHR